jgi:hypothetical protein
MHNRSVTIAVVRQEWWESERGWGCRPDDCSLHLTLLDRDQFIREYWAQMPKDVPDIYSSPIGEATTVFVDHDTYAAITASRCGIWST